MMMVMLAFLMFILACSNNSVNGLNLRSNKLLSKALSTAAFSIGIATGANLQQVTSSSGFLPLAPVYASDAKSVTSIFVGTYDDPNHPGCMRKITVKGKEVSIIGSDNIDGSNQWLIKAKEDFPGTIFVDFSPKGGPKDLLGVFSEPDNGIKWPDGNLWTKLSK
mmetsp:Transcript_26195/g.36037  ORF Transcript_26195/g.36037 Transcript_26195/m.36037 type:complete len:164 (+) Transcript_26195:33-524(+)